MSGAEAQVASATRNVSAKTVESSAWLYGRQLITNAINLGVMAILARKLNPADFGLVALAQVILRFTAILGGGNGIGDYLIFDRQQGREERVHAAFWLNLCLVSLMAAVYVALIPTITRFYAQPRLGGVLLVLIIAYVINQMAVVPDALLKRSLDYRRLVIRDTVLEIVSSLFSVVLAVVGWGVWSLIVPPLLAAPLRLVMIFFMTRWVPRLPLRVHQWKRMFGYSANVLGSELTNSITAEGDTLLVGKVLGSEALGIYNMAWQTANLVSRNVSGVVGKLAMPALSAVGRDVNRLRSGLKRMLSLLGLVTFPLLIGLFVVADEVVLTLYGPKWKSAVLPLRILIIFALRRAIGSPVTVIYNVVGRPDVGLKLGVLLVPFYVGAIYAGSHYGIVGVAAGVTLVRTLFGLIQFEVTARFVRDSIGGVLRPLLPAFLASCAMGGVVYAAKLLIGPPLPSSAPGHLAILVAVGALIYLVILCTICNNLVKELLSVSQPLWKPLSLCWTRLRTAI